MAVHILNGTEGNDNIQTPWASETDLIKSKLGDGNDFFRAWGAGGYQVSGGDGDDDIGGGAGGGSASGGAGNDTLIASALGTGSDFMDGGAGNDWLWAFTGYQDLGRGSRIHLVGGEGIDRFNSNHLGLDTYDGGEGFDFFHSRSYQDQGVWISLVKGGLKGGTVVGDKFIDIEGVRGTELADTLEGDGKDNVLAGDNGADRLRGAAGNDLLVGFASSYFFETFTGLNDAPNPFDYLKTAAFDGKTDDGAADALLGGPGNDVLLGGLGADTLNGGGGNDTVIYIDSDAPIVLNLATRAVSGGSGEGDRLTSIENAVGSHHDDSLAGSGAANVLWGRGGADTLTGARGADTLHGEDGADFLDGGGQADVLIGGAGLDTLKGGGGPDRFVFAEMGYDNSDTILDFARKADTIVLHRSVFAGIAPGELAESRFAISDVATKASHRILYDKPNGVLYYDPDGSGSGWPVEFARVKPNLALTADMFEVV